MSVTSSVKAGSSKDTDAALQMCCETISQMGGRMLMACNHDGPIHRAEVCAD